MSDYPPRTEKLTPRVGDRVLVKTGGIGPPRHKGRTAEQAAVLAWVQAQR